MRWQGPVFVLAVPMSLLSRDSKVGCSHLRNHPVRRQHIGGDVMNQWAVIINREMDSCHVDPGLEVDTWVETNLRSMVEVWMGWRPLRDAMSAGDITIDGAPNFTHDPLRWMEQSPLAGISQRSSEQQILVFVEKVRA